MFDPRNLVKGSGFDRVVRILNDLFIKEWNKQDGTINERLIRFLKWPFASNFFKLFGKRWCCFTLW